MNAKKSFLMLLDCARESELVYRNERDKEKGELQIHTNGDDEQESRCSETRGSNCASNRD